MAHLASSRWRVVPSAEVYAGNTDHRSVALHFDDAYLDFLNAAPILRRHGLPATVFASSDFIDPSKGQRASAGRGYLNADELRALDADPLFEVACHGKDHARLPVSGRTKPREPTLWGPETAFLWSLIPGDKSRWFDRAPPPVAEVPETDSALCANLWSGAAPEDDAARDARVTADLTEAREALSAILDRPVTTLCWPFDRVMPAATGAARAAGFTAFTGGRADNPIGQPTDTLSRTHITDRAAGGGPIWLEVLIFRARLEVASGNLLFWPLAALAARLRARRFAILHGPQAGATA
nr:polysaccharide deacetylase family protein [Maritimibacter sp. DP1N21-5]